MMVMFVRSASQLRKWLLLISILFTYYNVAEASAAGQETLVGVVGRDFVMLGADSSVSQSIALTASNLDKIAVLVEPFLSKDDARNVPSPLRQQTIVAAAAGDSADADRLIGLLSAYCALEEFSAGVGIDVEFVNLENDAKTEENTSPPGLSVTAVAHLARGQIASALRSRQQLKVCLLIAGMVPADETEQEASDYFVSKQVQWQVKSASQDFKQSPEKEIEGKTVVLEKDEESLELQPRLFWLDEYGSLQKLKYGAHGFGSNFCLSILDQGYKPNLSRQEAQDLIRECFSQLRTRYVINSPQPPCIKCVDAQGCRLI